MSDFKRTPESIEDLDEMLEDEFKTKDSSDETSDKESNSTSDDYEDDFLEEENDANEENNSEELEDVDEEYSDELQNEKNENVEYDEESAPRKRVSKSDYAFKKLRQEAKELKEKSSSYENFLTEMDEMARIYGYKDSKEMLETMRQKQLEEEARTKNIDPEVYKELQDTKRRIAEIEREKVEIVQRQKAENFIKTLDSFAQEYKLTAEEMDKIIANMDADGWHLDNIKNPTRLMKGYAAEIISERKTQKVLKKIKDEEKFVEKAFKNQSNVTEKSIDDIVKDDLNKFAKDNGYSFRF